MTPETFVDAIESEMETELSRLGSSRALYADTGGGMDDETVLDVAATAEVRAAETFESWADREAGEVAEAFADVAAEERDHYRAVRDRLAEPDDHEPGDVPAVQEYLRGCEGTAERLGGFVGRTLAADRSKTHVTGFFVGQADTETAAVFRSMGDDLDAQLSRALALLDAHCGDDDECWERAERGAVGAVEAAYEAYTDGLQELGVDPKPIC